MTQHSNISNDLEPAVRAWGEKLFSLIEAAEPPSFFTKKGLSGSLMEWAMRDEHFMEGVSPRIVTISRWQEGTESLFKSLPNFLISSFLLPEINQD